MRFVFLPGLDGSGTLFEPIVKLLPKDMPAPVVLSYPMNRYLPYDALESYVHPQLPTEPYLLIAESYGGPLAIHIASHRPEGLKGVVLSATFARWPVGHFGVWANFVVGPYIFRGSLLPWVARRLLRLQGLRDRQIDWLIQALSYAKPAVLAARLKEALKVDVLDELARCPVPVLCLYAKHDILLADRCRQLMKEANPRIKAVGFDTTHLLLQDKTEEALKEILDFVRTFDATNSSAAAS